MARKSVCDIFLENVSVDENGCTDIIYIEDLVAIDERFKSNNGCQWARKGSKLDNIYILKRYHANELGGKGNKVVAIQLQGFRDKAENHSIPAEVRKALAGKPCVVLGIVSSEMEIDHKNGKYDTEEYSIDDFQPMTKAVNDAKREHCKKCNACGIRFDATILGYPVKYIEGNETSPSCRGCFWYDPVAFRLALMKG